MKKELTFHLSSAMLGILISVMPQLLICEHCMKMGMRCTFSARIALIIGFFIFALSFLSLFFSSKEVKFGITISIGCFGLLSALISTIVVGFCDGKCGVAMCHCNPFTIIIMVTLSGLVIANSAVQAFILNKQK